MRNRLEKWQAKKKRSTPLENQGIEDDRGLLKTPEAERAGHSGGSSASVCAKWLFFRNPLRHRY